MGGGGRRVKEKRRGGKGKSERVCASETVTRGVRFKLQICLVGPFSTSHVD